MTHITFIWVIPLEVSSRACVKEGLGQACPSPPSSSAVHGGTARALRVNWGVGCGGCDNTCRCVVNRANSRWQLVCFFFTNITCARYIIFHAWGLFNLHSGDASASVASCSLLAHTRTRAHNTPTPLRRMLVREFRKWNSRWQGLLEQ